EQRLFALHGTQRSETQKGGFQARANRDSFVNAPADCDRVQPSLKAIAAARSCRKCKALKPKSFLLLPSTVGGLPENRGRAQPKNAQPSDEDDANAQIPLPMNPVALPV
ncbi:MAG: hypothetical protein ACI4SV_03665, partial [Duodenibacillus sp.]